MKTLIIFCVIFVVVQCWECPFHCFCYKWRELLRTNCVKRNLYNTFANFPRETQVLDLSYNVISVLHGNEFLDTNLHQLKYLILVHNRLFKIDKLSFNGLRYLEFIDLSFNTIEFIDPTTFNSNFNLKWLNLSYNPLDVKKGEPLLSKAPSLEILNMAGCELKNLGVKMFKNAENLQLLNLTHNNIEIIDLEVLKPLTNLQQLDVSRNYLICNDQTISLIQWLWSQKIKFSPFCQMSQRIVADFIPPEETEKEDNLNTEILENVTNTTSSNSTESRLIFGNLLQLIQAIPFYYVILCGIQVGILLGSCVTYFCLRKTKSTSDSYTGSQGRFVNNNPDNSTFALIPLRTPPGTPPSPYHSRLTFPSTFSLPR